MTRDRLEALKKARGDASDDGIVMIAVTADEKSKQTEHFFKEVEEVGESIDRIRVNVDEIKRIHKAIITATETDKKMKDRLEDLMDHIKRSAIKVRARLKAIEENLSQTKNDANMTAEYRIKRTQHQVLSKRFLECMSEYNVVQNEYRDKCKAFIQRQLEITGRVTSNDELEEMIESGNPAIFTQNILTNTQQERQTLADIEARHSDILKLEKNIKELHDMFMDMAMLVEQQGEMIDRIEYHVANTRDYVVKGREMTEKALTYQKKSRRKKFFIIICLTVVAIIVFGGIIGAFIPW